MPNDKIKSILQFMQREDNNGFWLEWYNEITNKESTFDSSYVIRTLKEWYNESNDNKYLNMIKEVQRLGSSSC